MSNQANQSHYSTFLKVFQCFHETCTTYHIPNQKHPLLKKRKKNNNGNKSMTWEEDSQNSVLHCNNFSWHNFFLLIKKSILYAFTV